MTRTGDREIRSVSGRLPDNPGELACMLIDCTIEGTILSRRNTAASVSRFSSVKMSSIFSRFNKAKYGMFFGSLVTIITKFAPNI